MIRFGRLLRLSTPAAACLFLVICGLVIWKAQPRLIALPAGTRADRVLVEKSRRRLTVFAKGAVLRSYPVALGRSPVGGKVREGDNRTPEGDFQIDWRNPKSAYHLSLHISYPGIADQVRARQGGYDPGGAIMIHGLRRGFGWLGRLHCVVDWTRGCIAVTNPEIEELGRIIPNGTPIRIQP